MDGWEEDEDGSSKKVTRDAGLWEARAKAVRAVEDADAVFVVGVKRNDKDKKMECTIVFSSPDSKGGREKMLGVVIDAVATLANEVHSVEEEDE